MWKGYAGVIHWYWSPMNLPPIYLSGKAKRQERGFYVFLSTLNTFITPKIKNNRSVWRRFPLWGYSKQKRKRNKCLRNSKWLANAMKGFLHILLTFFVLYTGYAPLWAQSKPILIDGIVMDEDTRLPVENATIRYIPFLIVSIWKEQSAILPENSPFQLPPGLIYWRCHIRTNAGIS